MSKTIEKSNPVHDHDDMDKNTDDQSQSLLPKNRKDFMVTKEPHHGWFLDND